MEGHAVSRSCSERRYRTRQRNDQDAETCAEASKKSAVILREPKRLKNPAWFTRGARAPLNITPATKQMAVRFLIVILLLLLIVLAAEIKIMIKSKIKNAAQPV